MKTFKLALSIFAVAFVTVVGLLAPVKSVQARSNPYGVVCLVNKTGLTIRYQYKWGSQGWKSDTLEADHQVAHSWTYDPGSKASPKFTVKFDADFTDGVYNEVYSLDREQAPDKSCDEGKIYNFETVNSRYIDLYSAD